MAGEYHSTRFVFDERREILWRTLCQSYFQRLVRPDFHVLELGAGYAHFINNIRCREKTALDQWEGLHEFASKDVRVHVGNVSNLDFLPDSSVDFAFASNLFEHLTQADFAAVLATLRRKLKPDGTLNILQPNYRRAYREYFDDYTHVAIYSDISLCDFLGANEYKILYSTPGLLPLTVKSRFPIVPLLIKGYLASPWKPMAKQMFIRAQPKSGAVSDQRSAVSS